MLSEKLMARVARYGGLRHFRFFERPLAASARQGGAGGVSLRMLGEAEAAKLALDPALGLRRESVAESYCRGDLCVAAFEGNDAAGFCWLAFSPLHHLDGVSVDFGSDVAWVYRSFVRSASRGRGIAPALYCHADETLLARGRSVSLICVESHNRASIAAALRAGYRHAGQALYVRRGPLFGAWCSDGVRRHRVRFFIPRATGSA